MAESLEPGGLQLVIKPLCLRRQRALRHLFKPQTPCPTKFGFRPSCVTPARKPETQCKLPTPLLPVQRSIQAYQRLADSRRLNPLFSVLFFAGCACTKPGVLVRTHLIALQLRPSQRDTPVPPKSVRLPTDRQAGKTTTPPARCSENPSHQGPAGCSS